MSEQDELLLNEIIPIVCRVLCVECKGVKCEWIQGDWAYGGAQKILAKVKQHYETLIGDTLRNFSDIQREEGHPKSYWAGYHYARGLIMSALKLEQKRLDSRDCPVYLKSQGKKWSPYIKLEQYPCNKCPFKACKCEGLDRPDREKIAKILFGGNNLLTWDSCNKKADQILALIKPLTEQTIKDDADRCAGYRDGWVEEAKKQERERIMGILGASDTPLDIKTEQALKEATDDREA